MLEAFKGWHPAVTTLLEATPADAILRNDMYDLQSLSQWSEGCVTLVGDAAHAMTPNLGQGACQGLEDAFVLAHALRRVHPISEAFQCYQHKRLTRATMIATRSRTIGAVAQWDHPFACWLRDHLLMLAPSRVLVKQLEHVASYPFDTNADAHTW